MAERRVRRPKDKDGFLSDITGDGPFQTFKDALGFAAAYGFARGRRVPFQQSGEPIRWDDFINRTNNERLVDMIAVVTTGDFSVLSNDRFDERLTIFEEYANGGLELIQELQAGTSRSMLDLLIDELFEFEGEPPSIDDLLGDVGIFAKSLAQ